MVVSSFFVYLYHKKQDMDTDGLRQFIVQKRELLSRETFLRRAFNRCEDMSDEMKNRYVEYLIDRLENVELDNRAMQLVLYVEKGGAALGVFSSGRASSSGNQV